MLVRLDQDKPLSLTKSTTLLRQAQNCLEETQGPHPAEFTQGRTLLSLHRAAPC